MNEPSVFNESKTMDLDVVHNMDGKNVTHKEAHNLYGLYMSKATFEGLNALCQTSVRFHSLVLVMREFSVIQQFGRG